MMPIDFSPLVYLAYVGLAAIFASILAAALLFGWLLFRHFF